MTAYQQLKDLFQQRAHLQQLEAIVSWDEAVNMPAGAGQYRANSLATLSVHISKMLQSDQIAEWLQAAEQDATVSDWDQANVVWMKKIYKEAQAMPIDLVQRFRQATLNCEQQWRVMRQDNNWQDFAPLLTEVVALSRERAQIRGELFNLSPYDALLDEYSPGVNQATIDPIFQQLQEFLPDFLQQVMVKQATSKIEDVSGHYQPEKQKQLGLEIMAAIGFDFNHGRLDVSHHPFCGGTARDVRITTRYNTEEFVSGLMAIAHETGHGMYDLGLPEQWLEQPVGNSLGMSMHESQSLLIEMQACRHPAFMNFLSTLIQKHFGNNSGFSAENLTKFYTKVQPDFIRVDADEVTYPLHVMLRYELEKPLIAGDLQVTDLPDAWDHYMMKFLGLDTKGNFADGVMQDVHWPAGCIGYFPAYTLGAMIAAQLFQSAVQAYPQIITELGEGRFSQLMVWLRENVHSKASSLPYQELLRQATGSTLEENSYIQHLRHRYQESL
jgi:carboxypeptidase Taq